jgi:NAD(P)H dehydrogenase (quinone)
MVVVTGATGKLGHHVVEGLLAKLPPSEVVAAVRKPENAADLAARSVVVRRMDYDAPETLRAALAGAEKVLLVSSSEVGRRVKQHAAVIDAAKAAGVKLLVYTSVLGGERSRLALAAEHQDTEKLLRASGVPYVLLRNGWYLENYTEHLGPALQHGAILGSAGAGRIGAAARADYAAAAVAVLTGTGHENRIYELSGDVPFTMPELATEVSRHSGKNVAYVDLPPEKYEAALTAAGVPAAMASVLADSDVGISSGELQGGSGDLRRLIGRPTTTLSSAIASALKR